jgi:hypothetical protein
VPSLRKSVHGCLDAGNNNRLRTLDKPAPKKRHVTRCSQAAASPGSDIQQLPHVIVQTPDGRNAVHHVGVDTMWTPYSETMNPPCGGPLLSN